VTRFIYFFAKKKITINKKMIQKPLIVTWHVVNDLSNFYLKDSVKTLFQKLEYNWHFNTNEDQIDIPCQSENHPNN